VRDHGVRRDGDGPAGRNVRDQRSACGPLGIRPVDSTFVLDADGVEVRIHLLREAPPRRVQDDARVKRGIGVGHVLLDGSIPADEVVRR
jgi:hypothetical protein